MPYSALNDPMMIDTIMGRRPITTSDMLMGRNSTSSTTVWQRWTSSGTSSSNPYFWRTTNSQQDAVWSEWVDCASTTTTQTYYTSARPATYQEPTPEEKAAAEARAAEYLKLKKEEERKRKLARLKSFKLLLSLLDNEQRKDFRQHRHFFVIGGETGTKYRIRENGGNLSANIDVYYKDKDQISHRICVHPPNYECPIGDHLVAQMLGLKFDEKDFLKVANVHGAHANPPRCMAYA